MWKKYKNYMLLFDYGCFLNPQMAKRKTHWHLPLVLLLIGGLIPRHVFAEQTLVFNTTFPYPISTKEQTGFVDVIARQALKRIGYGFISVNLPAERALRNANAGLDDGDLLRIGGLQKNYPNLIQVPEIIMEVEFSIFSKRNKLPITNWADLKTYSVAIITGWKILERNITDVVELTKVKNVDQLFAMLQKERVDTIVYSRWVGLGYIKQHDIAGIHIIRPAIAQRAMYIYLHKKHQALVPKLAKALRAMKSDGSYKKIFEKTLAPLAGK
jgi:polar amino acid transport system substrate-binding protein